MRRVILESPYAAATPEERTANIAYARACLRDCLQKSESPIASHLLYTQPGVLDDDVPAERVLGMKAGLEWVRVADAGVFYLDRGWSNGMSLARDVYEQAGVTIEERLLPGYAAPIEEKPSDMLACECGAEVDTSIRGQCDECGRSVVA